MKDYEVGYVENDFKYEILDSNIHYCIQILIRLIRQKSN